MKTQLLESLKDLIRDRGLATLFGAAIVLIIIFCISVGLALRPSDLQIVTHYSAFGVTNFYRDKWFYLLSFIIFGVVIAITHTLIAAKLYAEKGKSFAFGFGWLTIALVVIAWLIANSVLKVASL